MQVPKRVVLIGSYNGQDSLGDECLLKAVMDQIRTQNSGVAFDLHIHDDRSEFIQALAELPNVRVMPGLQTIYAKWHSLFARVKIKGTLSTILAGLTFPIALFVAALFDIVNARKCLGSLFAGQALFIYGGTLFSQQWYWLNAQFFFASGLLMRLTGGRIFMSPQQYGPMTSHQARLLRIFLKLLVSDWRTRNELDIDLLVDSHENRNREIYDDVFSNTHIYPSLPPADESKHILVNLRTTTFDDDDDISSAKFAGLSQLISDAQKHYHLPIVYFGVSDATFSDDARVFKIISNFGDKPEHYTSVGRLQDEYQLIDLAREAKLVISMSFHGCILSGIGGAPFIPVTEGQYYDFKYAGFEKYTSNQNVPILSLSDCNPARDMARVIDYVSQFDSQRVSNTRDEASRAVRTFYSSAMTP